MVQVRAYFGEREMGLLLEGHAEQGSYGSDLVCAGLSVLAYTMAQAFSRLEAEQKLQAPPRIQMEPGLGILSGVPLGQARSEVTAVLQTISDGIGLLGESFPEGIGLQVFKEDFPSSISRKNPGITETSL